MCKSWTCFVLERVQYVNLGHVLLCYFQHKISINGVHYIHLEIIMKQEPTQTIWTIHAGRIHLGTCSYLVFVKLMPIILFPYQNNRY